MRYSRIITSWVSPPSSCFNNYFNILSSRFIAISSLAWVKPMTPITTYDHVKPELSTWIISRYHSLGYFSVYLFASCTRVEWMTRANISVQQNHAYPLLEYWTRGVLQLASVRVPRTAIIVLSPFCHCFVFFTMAFGSCTNQIGWLKLIYVVYI